MPHFGDPKPGQPEAAAERRSFPHYRRGALLRNKKTGEFVIVREVLQKHDYVLEIVPDTQGKETDSGLDLVVPDQEVEAEYEAVEVPGEMSEAPETFEEVQDKFKWRQTKVWTLDNQGKKEAGYIFAGFDPRNRVVVAELYNEKGEFMDTRVMTEREFLDLNDPVKEKELEDLRNGVADLLKD